MVNLVSTDVVWIEHSFEKDIKALARAKPTPIAAEAMNMTQNLPTPWRKIWAPPMDCNSGESLSRMVVHKTMATASFKILSPKTSMFNTGSTSSAWNMATVATGSTADINEPNAKLSIKLSLYATSAYINIKYKDINSNQNEKWNLESNPTRLLK